MLNLLIDYAKAHGLTIEPGFKPKTIRWAIVCDRNGQYQNVQPIGTEDSGMLFKCAPHLEQPELKRGGDGCRHFLVDTLEVVTRYNGKKIPSEASEILAKHQFFFDLFKQASFVLPILGKIASSMADDATITDIVKTLSEREAKKEDKVTFAIMEDSLYFPLNDDSWHQWWRSFRTPLIEISESELLCFTSGNLVRPALTHPVVSGLRKHGGQPSGDRMSSFKQDSFQSYNLDQSQNAATSDDAAWGYRAALDDLIENSAQGIAGASVVHWYAGETKVEKQEDPMGLLDDSLDLSWLDEAMDEKDKERDALHLAKVFLSSLKSGENPRLTNLANYRYYAMILSANSGRVVAREWIEGQFGELAESIVAWYEALEITNILGNHSIRSPKIERVITSLLPPLKQGQKYADWIKPIGDERSQLWHAAISRNMFFPHKVLSRLVPLHQAFMLSGDFEEALDERSPNRAKNLSLLYNRMALLKAYHTRKGDKNMQPYLNEEHPSPAYHCGRIMAVYADLQHAALGDVGAGVVQRYYAAASATPALILGRLSRGSQFHLNKLEGGLVRWYEQRLSSIWGRIKDELPKALSLEEQSLFALGYYQQKAARNTAKEIKTNDNNELKGA